MREWWQGLLDRPAHSRGAKAVGYGVAVALVAAITAGIGLTSGGAEVVRVEHRAPVYLIAVLAAGAVFGFGPAVLAAVLSFLAFNWFFVEPRHTLVVADPETLQALLLFLLTAVVTGQLTALLRRRAAEAQRREQEALALHEISKALASGDSADAALRAALERLRARLGLVACDVLLPTPGGVGGGAPTLVPLLRAAALDNSGLAAALWVFAQGTGASRGTPVMGGRRPVRASGGRAGGVPPSPRDGEIFAPLRFEDQTVGVLYALTDARRAPLDAAEERFLAAACDQLALAVERGRLQREAVESEVRAQVLTKTDALRAALLSGVSHDLRTPLAAIKAAAGSLLQQDVAWDEPARREFAAQIEREADRLNRLVGNLLDLSRIDAGALVPDRQWYPLAELVDDTIARLAPVLGQHRVEAAIPETLPPVWLDYVLIQQVLANLLENAAKYAPAGTRIGVLAAHDAGAGRVRVRVEDEGPGLSPAERARVFAPFFRASENGTRTDRPQGGGVGLGLAVCAGFVAAHGGRIWAEPGPGGGAAFVFELPAEHIPSAEVAEAAPPRYERPREAVYRRSQTQAPAPAPAQTVA